MEAKRFSIEMYIVNSVVWIFEKVQESKPAIKANIEETETDREGNEMSGLARRGSRSLLAPVELKVHLGQALNIGEYLINICSLDGRFGYYNNKQEGLR
mgnify:CR=1 FL=1